MTAKEIISTLEMHSHVEGGYYKEDFRSETILPQFALSAYFKGDRVASTHIYFLLEYGQFSRLHRIASDEHWHFYSGHGLEIYEIQPDGNLIVHKLGSNLAKGEVFHTVIKGGSWFGSRCVVPNGYCLVGCTVAPGFDFQDFELADRTEMLQLYPQYESLILDLT